MLNIEVNLPIGTEDENRWMAWWGDEPVVFSLETVRKLFDDNPEEKDIRFNFNCDGGVVSEGFAIYDYLRTSGRNIHCNIEGKCHSMAVVMLLAAPLENRTANKHAQAFIHCVHADVYGCISAKEAEAITEALKADQEKILDIYADRTGEDKETLRTFMEEEKMRDTDFLVEHKFINTINAYNTNRHTAGGQHTIQSLTQKNNSKNMAKTITEALQMAKDCLGKISNVLTPQTTNYDHTDADGNVLFSTDVEDDTLEVGMAARPDGTFELPDGRTIVIADGAITEIQEATTEDEEVENLRNQVNELTEQNTTLTNQLVEAQNVITELQNTISSNYKPNNTRRITPTKKPQATGGETQAEHKNAMRKALGLKVKED